MQTAQSHTHEAFRQQTNAKKETLPNMVRRFYEKHDGNVETASEALAEALSNDRLTFVQIVGSEIENIAKMYAARSNCAERALVMSRSFGPARAVALAQGMARTLMDFPLVGGIKLSDATGAEVKAQSARYKATADDMAHKYRWLQAVAAKVPDASRVGDVLTADEVTALFGATGGNNE